MIQEKTVFFGTREELIKHFSYLQIPKKERKKGDKILLNYDSIEQCFNQFVGEGLFCIPYLHVIDVHVDHTDLDIPEIEMEAKLEWVCIKN
jgi:hypothetical protein